MVWLDSNDAWTLIVLLLLLVEKSRSFFILLCNWVALANFHFNYLSYAKTSPCTSRRGKNRFSLLQRSKWLKKVSSGIIAIQGYKIAIVAVFFPFLPLQSKQNTIIFWPQILFALFLTMISSWDSRFSSAVDYALSLFIRSAQFPLKQSSTCPKWHCQWIIFSRLNSQNR